MELPGTKKCIPGGRAHDCKYCFTSIITGHKYGRVQTYCVDWIKVEHSEYSCEKPCLTSTETHGKTDCISPAQSRQLVGFPRLKARDRISFGMAQNGTCKYFCRYSNYSNDNNNDDNNDNNNDYMKKKMKAKKEKYHNISVTVCSFQMIQCMN